MPATERPHYPIKRLHLWMGASSLALVTVTVWMLVADHVRQWKGYQRTFQDRIEPWMTEARLRQERRRESPDPERLDRLKRTLRRQRPNLTKRLLRLPLIDAFGRPLAIDQIWLPELTIDYHFRQVARFDRCVTCHQGIDRTLPGRPAEPAFRPVEELTVRLATPERPPEPQTDPQGNRIGPSLEKTYGLALAEQGILDPQSATVVYVAPRTPAADAKLIVGDVILKIDGREPIDRAAAEEYLLEQVEWGRPVVLEIRRGLPHPYRSHPRLDLFVGASSPHPMAEFGCTICHDGQGSATGFKWASHGPNDPRQRERWRAKYGWLDNPHWDFPMLPRRFVQSRCLRCHHEVTDLEPSRRRPDPPAEKLLAGYHLIRRHGCFGCHEIKGFEVASAGHENAAANGRARSIGPDMRLEPHDPQARDKPLAGTLRKVGPSLRDAGGRLEAVFLADWIADPTHFRPETRMPRFYGLHEHLQGRALEDAKRFEAVEIRAIAAYLLAVAEPVEPQPPPPEVTEPPDLQRGKHRFEIHGCLACHKHEDFPKGQSTQGPDLSNLGSKYTTKQGQAWLASWIRDPVRHAPRTLMPGPLLEAVPLGPESQDAEAKAPAVTDPAADIAEYLLSGNGWEPKAPPPLQESDLDDLAWLHLRRAYPGNLARRYLQQGIPRSRAGRVDPDAVELSGETTPEDRLPKKLRYVGRQTIRKRGCYGCHDIPGFEQAQPIGPALTDWGRKQESLLAFEQINRFIGPARLAAAGTAAPDDNSDRAFFLDALLAHRREGFLWQKLRAPRSFDFNVAGQKPYNQWLTMGQFKLTDREREAIMTFVLGLVAEPPADQYIDHPDRRRRAIIEGGKVLDKYACRECHTLEMQRWAFEFDPDEFEGPPILPDYDFLKPRISPRRLAASIETDLRGLGRAEVVGMPRVDATGEPVEGEDDHGNPLYFFTLFEPAVINGEVWPVGGAEVMIAQAQLVRRRPAVGGAFARLLYPVVLAEARQAGSAAPEQEAWGWLPPPLADEGAKVQPAWLHDYLLEPTSIRPAAVLRMPRYNLSAAEAAKLVDYFAAVSGADFPYSSHPRTRTAYVERRERAAPGRLQRAMQMLVDSTTYCAKCHVLGGSGPGGAIRTTLAPDLEQVGRRIRPEYLRRWLANPKSQLPYTAMPVNFPPSGQPLDPTRFPGESLEQLDAVMDLLLNYDWYVKRRVPIRRLLEPGAGRGSAPGAQEQ